MTPTPRKRVIDRLSADVESQLKAIEDGDDISHQIIKVTDGTGRVFAMIALSDWREGSARLDAIRRDS